jgi:hypothetical protein
LREYYSFISCEPAITPISDVFYRMFHPETVVVSVDPLASDAIAVNKTPRDANQATPTLLVGPYREAFAKAIPELRLRSIHWFSFLAYRLSGRFRSWSLIPHRRQATFKNGMDAPAFTGSPRAFRLLGVYEKQT